MLGSKNNHTGIANYLVELKPDVTNVFSDTKTHKPRYDIIFFAITALSEYIFYVWVNVEKKME